MKKTGSNDSRLSSKSRKILKAARDTQKPLTICINKGCKLRVNGCKGFEGCPGYKTL